MASHEKGFTAPGSVADSHCIPVLARRHGASWHNAGRNLLLVQNYYIFFVSGEKTLFSVSFLSKINLLGCLWRQAVKVKFIEEHSVNNILAQPAVKVAAEKTELPKPKARRGRKPGSKNKPKADKAA